MSAELLKKLREPFPENQISLLPKPYKKDSPKGNCKECGGYHGLPAVHLKYVGHAALTDRLLDVDPEWSWEPLAFDQGGLPLLDGNGGMWIKLTVCGVTRYGYGDAQGKTGGDAMKERIGDALRNAAMRFGAALDLWHKGDLHNVEDDGDQKEEKKGSPPKNGQQAKVDTPPSPLDKIISGIDFFSEKKKTVAELETWYINDEGLVVTLKAELTPDELALANKYYAQIKATLKPATQQKTQLRPGVTDAQPGDFF